jgi:drug/metabolite transporter (DMT)-like permease
MVEPVVASIAAWAWLGESLSGQTQLIGGLVVLLAIILAQSSRD